MDDKRIEKKLKDTFNTEVPDVLTKIKASPEFRVPLKEKGFSLRNILNKRLIVSLSSLFVVVILLFAVIGRSNYIVASTVTLELNPSIEIYLNKNDYVIKVVALNDDGEEVIEKDIKYRGLSIDDALVIIVERLNELGYVVDTTDENNIILVSVNSDNEAIKARLQNKFATQLQMELSKYNNSHWVFNSDDFQLTDEQLRFVKNNDLLSKYSFAKIALAYRINSLEPDYTLATLSRMSIRNLYDLYIALENPDNLPQKNQMPPSRNNNQNESYSGGDLNIGF
ncbi:hypothetical protein KQ51_01077 [Candidatus Izimaplasma bacterium HR1]|uniref:anti-sigma-I factor RsgI family protein n=1 Tax=Candidatus Izimoplasma sp. HR1 TaxID=1541959 RepID=UPI0004F8CD6B|nr:hypothetical protein KQ51_01077 [Candidatus Izimaplasma bacterium HR1]